MSMSSIPQIRTERSDSSVGDGSPWLRRLSPGRHYRSVLAVCCALIAVLCVLAAYDAVSTPEAPEYPPFAADSTDAGAQVDVMAGASAARRAALHSTPVKSERTASHSTPSVGSESGVLGIRSVRDDNAAPKKRRKAAAAVPEEVATKDENVAAKEENVAASAPNMRGTVAKVPAGGGDSRLPAIADADATGANRSDVEARAADLLACAVVEQDAPTRGLRVRHSTQRAPDLAVSGGDDYEWDPDALREIDPAAYQFPFRVPEVPGARTYGEVQWCPGSLEPPPEAVPPVDPAYRALFLIGAQKAGTSWLHHALSMHPAVVYGNSKVDHKMNKQKGSPVKELQFFNTWPARSTEEFLSMWPPAALAAMRNGTSQKFLFDGSPEYLLNAAVPPRMKQMVPQAKIVVVLRDPTDRAFSAWGMQSGWEHFCDADDVPVSQLCVERSFDDTFNAWHNSFARPECRFTTPGSSASWGECFGCRYNLFRFQRCCEMRQQGQEGMLPCFGVPRGFSVLDYSAYAAQLAWWLEFFPPEQIFVVTSETLHDETQRVQVLNDLLDFVGLPDAPRFNAEQVNAAAAFNGHYSNISDADVAAKATVRRFHAPQVRDLHALLSRFWPDADASALAQWPQTAKDA